MRSCVCTIAWSSTAYTDMPVTMLVHEPLGRTRGAAIVMAPCRSRKAEDTRRRQRRHRPLCCCDLSVQTLHVRAKITDIHRPQEHVTTHATPELSHARAHARAQLLLVLSSKPKMGAEAPLSPLFPLFHNNTACGRACLCSSAVCRKVGAAKGVALRNSVCLILFPHLPAALLSLGPPRLPLVSRRRWDNG